MNRKNFLELFDGVNDEFVLEAFKHQKASTSRPSKSRLILIAAMIALMVFLMGCVSVYLSLQQRKIGEVTITQNFDEYGNTIPTPEKTMHIASMSGFGDSPAMLASGEWNEFQRSYRSEITSNESDLPDIPNQYEYTYHCFDQTMVDRLLEIAQKYDLQLLGTRAVAQSWQRDAAFEALGISGFIRENAPAEAGYGACRLYPPYNFICDVRLTLTGADAAWQEEAYCEFYYLHSGYLAHDDAFLYDPESTQEWEYTTADGTKVLLALSGKNGFVVAQRQDSTIVITIDLAWMQGVFLEESTPLPTSQALEQLADCFDYTITTQAVPMEGMQATLDAIPDPYAADAPNIAETIYTSFADYLKENCLWPELMEYAFYDLDGDGTDDLITSLGDGFCCQWLGIRDGQVMDFTGGRGAMRLCEGGIVEARESENFRMFFKLAGQHPVTGTRFEQMDIGCSVRFFQGVWKIDDKICTAQEAADFIAQFKPLQLDWKPLVDFPMDDRGNTFGQILEREGTLSGQKLLDFYREHCPKTTYAWDGSKQIEPEYNWFTLRDINGDGIDDILLSVDGVLIDSAYTCKRGKLFWLDGGFQLCTDNAMYSIGEIDEYNLGKTEYHIFRKMCGNWISLSEWMRHMITADIWEDDTYTQIAETDAQAYIDRHPIEKLQMQPISQLFG